MDLGGSLGFDANGPVTCIDEGLIDPNVFCPRSTPPCVWLRWGDVFQFLRGHPFRRRDLVGRRVCATDAGCMCPWACNFDDQATSEDGSCDFLSCAGCTYAWSSNYDPEALYDDGSCIEDLVEDPCQADLNEDGSVSTADLLQFLTAFGEGVQLSGRRTLHSNQTPPDESISSCPRHGVLLDVLWNPTIGIQGCTEARQGIDLSQVVRHRREHRQTLV